MASGRAASLIGATGILFLVLMGGVSCSTEGGFLDPDDAPGPEAEPPTPGSPIRVASPTLDGSPLSCCTTNDFAVSGDGLTIAYISGAANLADNDTNSQADLFAFDVGTGTVERVSVNSDEVEANRSSSHPSLSADGNLIVFESEASNLSSDDVDNRSDIFLRDRAARKTVLLSAIGADAFTSPQPESTRPAITSNGEFVAFLAGDTYWETLPNLGLDDHYVFVYKLSTGQLEPVAPGRFTVDISGDGRWIVSRAHSFRLEGAADELGYTVEGNLNGTTMYLFDRVNRVVFALGVAGGEAIHISDSGGIIAFQSGSDDLVGNDTNNSIDVFLASVPDVRITRISVSQSHEQLVQNSVLLGMSHDGTRVLFETGQSLFVFDTSRDAVVVVPHDERGYLADKFSGVRPAAISGGGYIVAFAAKKTPEPYDGTDALYVALKE